MPPVAPRPAASPPTRSPLPVASYPPPSPRREGRKSGKRRKRGKRRKMACDLSSPRVPPIAALCKDVQQPTELSKHLKNVYQYEVLGQQYTSPARAELHQEQPDNPLFTTILAEVYVGLSDDEVLYLASRHNINGHYIHKMTHQDYVNTAVN